MTRPLSYGEALVQLSSAQKSAKGAPAYSRFVNRPVGRHLAALTYRMGMVPNQVTGVSALFSAVGIALIALVPPSPVMAAGVALALAFGYALDSADGQLARLTGTGSTAGEWLDHVVDAAKISALHAAVLLSYYRFFELANPTALLIPIGFGLVGTVLFFGMILRDQLSRQHRAGAAPVQAPSTVRSVLVLPTDYGLLCWVFLLYAVPVAFFVVYGLMLAGNVLFLLAATIKWFRELAKLDTARAVAERLGGHE